MILSKLTRYNLLAIFACLLWSSSFVTVKHAQEYQTPLNLAGLRFILAGLIQIPFCGSLLAPLLMLRKEFKTVLMLLLSGAFVSAIGNVVVAKRKGGLHPVALNSAQMLIGGVVLLIIALPFEGTPNLKLPAVFYGDLLWLAMVSSLAFSIWFFLLSRIKVSKLNLWKFIIPLGGALLSWLFLPDESPTWPSLAGMAFIVTGIIIGQRESK